MLVTILLLLGANENAQAVTTSLCQGELQELRKEFTAEVRIRDALLSTLQREVHELRREVAEGLQSSDYSSAVSELQRDVSQIRQDLSEFRSQKSMESPANGDAAKERRRMTGISKASLKYNGESLVLDKPLHILGSLNVTGTVTGGRSTTGTCFTRYAVWGCSSPFTEIVRGRTGGMEYFSTYMASTLCINASALLQDTAVPSYTG